MRFPIVVWQVRQRTEHIRILYYFLHTRRRHTWHKTPQQNYRRYLCSTRNMIYVCNGRTSIRMSVCLSHRSIAASAAGGFAAERRCLQQMSIERCGRRAAGAGAQQQILRAGGGGSTQTCFEFCQKYTIIAYEWNCSQCVLANFVTINISCVNLALPRGTV